MSASSCVYRFWEGRGPRCAALTQPASTYMYMYMYVPAQLWIPFEEPLDALPAFTRHLIPRYIGEGSG